jgi:hypothetical protein
MAKLIQLREEMTKVLTDVKEIQTKDDRSADDESRLDQLLARANALGPEILREKQIDDAAAQLDDYTQPASNGSGRHTTLNVDDLTPPRNRPAPPSPTNYGKRYVASDQFDKYRHHPTGNSERFTVGSFHKAVDDEGELDLRTLLYTGGVANLVQPTRQPGVYGPSLLPFQVRMRDVLSNSSTNSNSIQFVRESSFTNAAAPTAEAVSTSTGSKPESALGLTVVTSPVATIAHVVPVTRQTIDDVPQMQGYVNGRLIDGLKLVEDQQVLAGDGTGANLTGILSTSGIGNLDATYWTANPLPTTGAAANKADRIRRARKYVEVTGLAQPNFVVIHPDDLEILDELKDTTGNYVFSDPVGGRGIPTLWNLTIVPSTSQPTNTFLVGDGRFAAGINAGCR